MNFIAKINLDGLLPLIIGAIWVIAQVAGAAAKKKGAPQRPAARPATSENDPLAEFMRKLGGGQEFEIPTMPEPETVVDAVSPPRSQPIETNAVRTPRLQSTSDPDKVAAVDIRPTMSSFKVAMPAMKLPAMNLSFRTSEKSGSGVPRVGKIINPADKQTLRRAVLGQIILGKPRSMEGWNHGMAK